MLAHLQAMLREYASVRRRLAEIEQALGPLSEALHDVIVHRQDDAQGDDVHYDGSDLELC